MDNPSTNITESNGAEVQQNNSSTDIDDVFPPHVDTTNIVYQVESPTNKKQALKTFKEINQLLQTDKKREVKLLLRENAWPLNNGIRSQLWPALCNQHSQGKGMMEGFYWDMVGQVLGTTGY